MTKEWYETVQRTDLHLPLRITKYAEAFSEPFYRALYAEEEAAFVQLWKDIWTYKPSEPPSFDPEAVRKEFRLSQRWAVKRLKAVLPEDILRQVADIRVLALDRASAAVKKEIASFCAQNEKAVARAMNDYKKQYKEAFKNGEAAFAGQFDFHDCKVISCRRQGENLVLKLDNAGEYSDADIVIFESCTVLKQERPFRNAIWLYEEIYPTENGYEIHALLQNGKMLDFIARAANVRCKCTDKGENQ